MYGEQQFIRTGGDWSEIVRLATTGKSPWKSAQDVAQDFINDQSYSNLDECADAAVRWAVARKSAAGVGQLFKLIPFVGGAVGAGVDGAACYAVGKMAKKLFKNEEATFCVAIKGEPA